METLKKLLIFQEIEPFGPPKKISYISGSGNPKNLLIFQKVTLKARKNKKIHPEKNPYISRNGTSLL